ncbi:MAG TPA: hypothetical protein VN926_07735 [Bradyrhizobium sp.]|jgi:hypothetical protein|nr:hypothetical protein [Bradyrhizobium sp.]
MNEALAAHEATHTGLGTQTDRAALKQVCDLGRHAPRCDSPVHVVAVVGGEGAEACAAKKCCLLENRLEDRRQIAG